MPKDNGGLVEAAEVTDHVASRLKLYNTGIRRPTMVSISGGSIFLSGGAVV